MVRRALVAGAVMLPVAAGIAYLSAGPAAAWSAGLGVAVVVLNFAVHGLSLAWAAGVSVTAVQATALGGFLVRMALIAGVLFALDRTAWFSAPAFAVAAVAAMLALLTYEARLITRGVGGILDIPPDRAAVEAAERLRAKEGLR
jgi:hypothetical protein